MVTHKAYNNMFEDSTWKREIGEKDQIIALTTKLTEMQAKLEKQVAAFATNSNLEGTSKRILKTRIPRVDLVAPRRSPTQLQPGV